MGTDRRGAGRVERAAEANEHARQGVIGQRHRTCAVHPSVRQFPQGVGTEKTETCEARCDSVLYRQGMMATRQVRLPGRYPRRCRMPAIHLRRDLRIPGAPGGAQRGAPGTARWNAHRRAGAGRYCAQPQLDRPCRGLRLRRSYVVPIDTSSGSPLAAHAAGAPETTHDGETRSWLHQHIWRAT